MYEITPISPLQYNVFIHLFMPIIKFCLSGKKTKTVINDPSIVVETLGTNMVGSGLTGWVNETPTHYES